MSQSLRAFARGAMHCVVGPAHLRTEFSQCAVATADLRAGAAQCSKGAAQVCNMGDALHHAIEATLPRPDAARLV